MLNRDQALSCALRGVLGKKTKDRERDLSGGAIEQKGVKDKVRRGEDGGRKRGVVNDVFGSQSFEVKASEEGRDNDVFSSESCEIETSG
jgi:hypothetical protein